MKLSEDQIKDLESRGIKPGIVLECAYMMDHFIFDSWDRVDFRPDDFGDIVYETDEDIYWLYDAETLNYATPIE